MNAESSTNQIAELSHADFDATIQCGVTLVDFWAPWCGPCRMQGPVLDQVARQAGTRATLAKVNVDDEPHLAERFQITSIPTLLLFKDGQMVRQFMGVQSAAVLLAAIETAQ